MNFEKFYNTNEIKRFYFPGKIFSGINCLDEISEGPTLNQGSMVWIFVDSYFIDNNLVSKVINKFEKNSTIIHYLSGKPITENVHKFIQENMSGPVSTVIAIGGGSIIDFAKASLASLIFSSIDGIGLDPSIYRITTAKKPIFIAIPTTAGSGAEASRYYVTYNHSDNQKNYGKSWELIADYIYLEPRFITELNHQILIECAFDVFIHLLETAVCKYEKSQFGQILSISSIYRTMTAIQMIVNNNDKQIKFYKDLMESATIGGIAISNTRTGNIHEAAGALLEKTTLNHPQTLFVFFRKAIEQYKSEIFEFESNLINSFRINAEWSDLKRIDDVIGWWEVIFEKFSIKDKIAKTLINEINDVDSISHYIYNRIASDLVWKNKESPVVLNDKNIKAFINESLSQYGLHQTQ